MAVPTRLRHLDVSVVLAVTATVLLVAVVGTFPLGASRGGVSPGGPFGLGLGLAAVCVGVAALLARRA
jgi:hypothetical protein